MAWAYYHFSVQFRENLEAACDLFPQDEKLAHLTSEECNTSNLSPWPGVALPGENMNHDEFMRRLLLLEPIPQDRREALEAEGARYLATVRPLDEHSKAMSIASYEDGGLECVFRAILTAPAWEGPLLGAFSHFCPSISVLIATRTRVTARSAGTCSLTSGWSRSGPPSANSSWRRRRSSRPEPWRGPGACAPEPHHCNPGRMTGGVA